MAQVGQPNTSYFHKKLGTNNFKNKILSIQSRDGVSLEDPDSIKKEIIDFYKQLLGSAFSRRYTDLDTFQSMGLPKVKHCSRTDLI